LFSSLKVVSGNKRILLNVGLHNHHVLVDDWRTAVFPLVIRIIEPTGIKHAEVLFPLEFSVQVVCVETVRAEIYNQIFSVGDRCGIGVRRLGMPLHFGHAFESNLLPQDFPCRFIDRVNLPGMFRIVFDWSDVAVKSEPGLIFRAAGDGADDENLVAPNYRAGMRQTWDRSFPTHVG
jgi:hypothetical protein